MTSAEELPGIYARMVGAESTTYFTRYPAIDSFHAISCRARARLSPQLSTAYGRPRVSSAVLLATSDMSCVHMERAGSEKRRILGSCVYKVKPSSELRLVQMSSSSWRRPSGAYSVLSVGIRCS